MERALILLQQSRPDLAETELRRDLAADPDNPVAHALLALCLVALGRDRDATPEAEEAVRLAPDLPFAHYALASVLHHRDRLDEAQTVIEEAIRLDPEDADHFALLSAIQYGRRRWRDALESAERGLQLDAEHVRCNNLRAMALVQLGRREEAGATIDAALARDPENAVTHANQGWALLHRADYPKALEHFREALRLNPDLGWAREGIVEALKAQNPIYGLMLRYFLWMSRLSGRARWAVILGAYFGYRLLRDVARGNPGLSPFLTPVLIAYGVFVLLTWIADPLFNLMLRLNRFGRYALSREQVVASNWLGGFVLAALIALGAYFATGRPLFISAALLLGLLTIPVAGTFHCPAGWPRMVMGTLTTFLALAGLGAIALSLAETTNSQQPLSDGPGTVLFAVVLIGVFVSGWVGNALATVRVKK